MTTRPVKHRSPYRGVAFALIILALIPTTRELILTGAGYLLSGAASVAMFAVGGLVMLLIACSNPRRRR